jgi:hypothetical protein
MALAPRRQIFQTNIDYSLNEITERGKLCCILPGTTPNGEVTAAVVPTGVGVAVIGMLLDDVEDMNFDRHGEYRQRNVVDVGSVVGLCQEGELETDQLTGSPVAGNLAYLNVNGTVSPTQLVDGLGNNAPLVGKFLSAPNANGFAKLRLDV